jgi:acyl-CoA synthetase (AMP-forming)/AMP-acid ligase II
MPRELHTMPEHFANAVSKWPRRAAAVSDGRVWSYQEVSELSGRLATYLCDRYGVGPQSRVGIAMRNRAEIMIAYWAASQLGAAVLPLNYKLGGEAVRNVLTEAEMACLVIDEQGLRGIEPHLTPDMMRRLICVDTCPDGAAKWDEAVTQATSTHMGKDVQPSSPAVILYTSGTTGLPKGAVMTHHDLCFNIRMAIVAHSLRHEDVHLLAIPFFVPTACYTLINAAAYLGATLVMAPDAEPSTILPLLSRWKCTTFFGVPTMFFFLTAHPHLRDHDLSALRLMAYSGSPMPVRTIRRLRELFPSVWLHNFFGLTETIAMTHVLSNADADEKPESIGKLLPEIDAAVVAADGAFLSAGEVGELVFARDVIIREYWRRPGLLEESIRGRWFHTGDLASVDEDGYFFVHGRSKDMIIVAGQNVYALEVEQVIMRMEQVREVAVVGVPATGVRAPLGELVKAVVVPHPGEKLTERDVKRHCSQYLPSYKGPHIVEFREELPRNPAGKVIKHLLVG